MVESAGQPALQIIVLGSGGGPLENNTTAFLVRSTASGWNKGSILAVDAGVHLAAIVKILESHPSESYPNSNHGSVVTLRDGPFAGLELPNLSPKANAAYIARNLIETCLITHPHLDHISAFVVNTAGLLGARPKRLAGLPSTIEAFKNHIFNDIIWPNLSDENYGAGLVTYMRLVDGGSPAVGDGEGKGYIEICEGLGVKPWSVSHGLCIGHQSHRSSNVGLELRRESSPRLSPHRAARSYNSQHSVLTAATDSPEQICVYNSTVYFIRDIATGREILICGDIEPDSISLSPRNRLVWAEAAEKIVSGRLSGIFIECSYDDSQSDDRLYGHMVPRFLSEELKVLAEEVEKYKAKDKDSDTRKSKRMSNMSRSSSRQHTQTSINQSSPISPLTSIRTRSNEFERIQVDEDHNIGMQIGPIPIRSKVSPLENVQIVIIHVKDNLLDGPETGEVIIKELEEYEAEAQLGCKFTLSDAGRAVYL